MCLGQIFRFRAYFTDKFLMENLWPPLTKARWKVTDLSVPRYQVKPNSVSPVIGSVFSCFGEEYKAVVILKTVKIQ